MRAWKQDCFFFSLSCVSLALSTFHSAFDSISWIFCCLCTLARFCLVWLYQSYYAVFTSILFVLFDFFSFSVRDTFFFFSSFAIHLWIRDCRDCIENLKTISFSLFVVSAAAIAIQTLKSLDRTEWMYSDLEIDAVFLLLFLFSLGALNLATKKERKLNIHT